jgi:hypothetical protein
MIYNFSRFEEEEEWSEEEDEDCDCDNCEDE